MSVRGDALRLPIADSCVDLIVTSPPYFGLRSYTDGGAHYRGQIGAEPTPTEFVDALVAATREMIRVLKPAGSIWVNLGDKYAGSSNDKPHTGSARINLPNQSRNFSAGRPAPVTSVRSKSLIGIPWRYALRCVDDLGLILRAEVIWSKPNGLPESVTDRVRRSHEQWFHFVLQPRYFAAVDEIREAHQPPTAGRNPNGARGDHYRVGRDGLMTNGIGAHPTGVDGHLGFNPLGKLPGSVWTVPTEPLQVPAHLGVDHFAAFPSEWPRRLILGWSPGGVCTVCGEGRRPVGEREKDADYRPSSGSAGPGVWGPSSNHRRERVYRTTWVGLGYVCACPDSSAHTTRSVVLDPFGGTGTTSAVAAALGRTGISCDLSADYCRLAAWRATDPGLRAKVLGVAKPAAVMAGQDDLFSA